MLFQKFQSLYTLATYRAKKPDTRAPNPYVILPNWNSPWRNMENYISKEILLLNEDKQLYQILLYSQILKIQHRLIAQILLVHLLGMTRILPFLIKTRYLILCISCTSFLFLLICFFIIVMFLHVFLSV